jgi:hypothetical protein
MSGAASNSLPLHGEGKELGSCKRIAEKLIGGDDRRDRARGA